MFFIFKKHSVHVKHLREHAKYKPRLRFLSPGGEGRQPRQAHKQLRRGSLPAAALGGTEERLPLQPRLRERAWEPAAAPQVVLDRPLQWHTPSHRPGRMPSRPGPSFTLHEQSGWTGSGTKHGLPHSSPPPRPGSRMEATAPTSPEARTVHTLSTWPCPSHPGRQL